MSVFDKIVALTKQLYPKGRAFKMPLGSDFEKLTKGLAVSEATLYNNTVAIFDSMLPDNDNFTSQDATDWERRLGMVQNASVPIADRKAAITRKMNHPSTIPARQHHDYVQGQLREADFDVYVIENIFPDGGGGFETRRPLDVNGGVGADPYQLGEGQLGDSQLGSFYTNKIVNYIDSSIDELFNEGANLRSTFFICGHETDLTVFANVDEDRKDEFRQLILKLKPAHTVGYLFVNYV